MLNKKLFVEYLDRPKCIPHSSIVNAIDDNKFPFNKNSFYTHNPQFLASEEYNRCVESYFEKTPNATLEDIYYLLTVFMAEEDNIRNELELLCVNIVKSLYGIPNKIKLQAKIKWIDEIKEGDQEEEKKEIKKLTEQQIHSLRYEIERRRILNSIVHGSAIHQWTSIFYIIKEEINKLNPNLMDAYNQYATLVNYFNWQHSMSVDNVKDKEMKRPNEFLNKPNINVSGQAMNLFMIKGYSIIDYANKSIEAIGVCLPIILHELLKSIMEFIVAKGLPNHLEEEELKYVLEKADKYQHEFWHYYMGPTLWRAILETSKTDTVNLPKIVSYMSQLNYEDLSTLCTKITFDPNDTGKKAMNKIKLLLNI